jgi:sugar lactone lactonase YvrE
MTLIGKIIGPIALVFKLCGVMSVQSAELYPYPSIGDGKPGIDVVLTLVDGIATDPHGNIYISHRSQNRIRKLSPNGTITTIAGNGIAGFSGDGGPALESSLNFPAGLVFDKENLYVADRNNHRIRKIDSKGIISTVAGTGIPECCNDNGLAVEAHLYFPSDIDVDTEGNLYISDRSNNRIRKVNSDGIITTIAGLGKPGYGGDFGPADKALLKYPFGISLDNKGNFYIADRGNNRVRKIDQRGIITTIAGDGTHSFGGDYGPANQSSLAFPTDVTVDSLGTVYIADRNNNRVRKIDRLGVITTLMGLSQTEFNGDNEISAETTLHLPFALALNGEDRLLVVDRNHFRVREVRLQSNQVETVAGNGTFLFRGDGGPGGGATLEAPSGIAVDSKGNVLFADRLHQRIRRVGGNGIIETVIGNGKQGNEGNGRPGIEATLHLPEVLVMDREDNIYLTQRSGNAWIIRKSNAEGIITHFAGNGRQGNTGDGGPAIEASFHTISDIAADGSGNIFIADSINRNIRKIDKQGIISTIAEASLEALGTEVHPNGIVVDKAGSIFFSDSGSSKVYKIDTSGAITLIAGTGDFGDHGDGGPALEAGLRSPGGLAIGPDGFLYIAEQTTHRIRKVDSSGIITGYVGTGKFGYSGDGGPAIEANIKNPFRMDFDREGNLYFSDRDNNRIRKVDTSGVITTIAGHSNIGWLQDGLEVRITVHNFP